MYWNGKGEYGVEVGRRVRDSQKSDARGVPGEHTDGPLRLRLGGNISHVSLSRKETDKFDVRREPDLQCVQASSAPVEDSVGIDRRTAPPTHLNTLPPATAGALELRAWIGKAYHLPAQSKKFSVVGGTTRAAICKPEPTSPIVAPANVKVLGWLGMLYQLPSVHGSDRAYLSK